VVVRIDLVTFARALMGCGNEPCVFEVRPEMLGRRAEVTVEALVLGTDYPTLGAVVEAARHHEADGWEADLWEERGSRSRMPSLNHHRIGRAACDPSRYTYAVTFRRWVPADPVCARFLQGLTGRCGKAPGHVGECGHVGAEEVRGGR
jgi:hypothetical protein